MTIFDIQRQRPQREEEARVVFEVGRSVGYTENQLASALRTESRLPFLLTCLPNVSALFLSAQFVAQCGYDCFQLALQNPGVLRHLQKATLFGSRMDRYTLEPYPSWEIKNVQEVFFLPFLRTLALFNIELHSMLELLLQKVRQPSLVTHLAIVPGGDPRLISPCEKEILKACLQLPKALVSLTLYLPRHTSMRGGHSPSYMISNDQLWQMLSSYRQSLEYLDIYDQDACHNQTRFQQKPHLGLLSDFKSLRILRIQPQVLLGGFNGIIRAPFRLRSTMPVSVHALTLYGPEGLSTELEPQLAEIVGAISYAKLKFLILEDTSNYVGPPKASW